MKHLPSQIHEESKESEQPGSGLNGIKGSSKNVGNTSQREGKLMNGEMLSLTSEHLDADYVDL